MRGAWLVFLVACEAERGSVVIGGSGTPTGGGIAAGTAAGVVTTGDPDTTPTTAPLPVDLVDVDWYEHLVQDVLYTHLGDDRGFGPEHDLARDAIAAELTDVGLDVALEPFVWQGETWHNVVGTLPGTDPDAGVIVVGAHFDSVNNPGADDNATGTALVLEAARVLAACAPATTLRFVLFDREEQGLRGSAAYVAAHRDETLFALTADMIGQDHGGNAVDLFSTAASVGLVESFAAATDTWGGGLGTHVRTGNAFGFSDHASFEDAGVPAFVIIEADYGLNPNYHQATDAVDSVPGYVDYAYVEGTLRAVVGFLADEAAAGPCTTP